MAHRSSLPRPHTCHLQNKRLIFVTGDVASADDGKVSITPHEHVQDLKEFYRQLNTTSSSTVLEAKGDDASSMFGKFEAQAYHAALVGGIEVVRARATTTLKTFSDLRELQKKECSGDGFVS